MFKFLLRYACNLDANALYKIHINSISKLCSNAYNKQQIEAWINSKSPQIYTNLDTHRHLIVAEAVKGDFSKEVAGFGQIDINSAQNNAQIKGIYISPEYSKMGCGSLILKELEAIALHKNMYEINLYSTLNSIEFYKKYGYEGNNQCEHKIRETNISLECIAMQKKL